MFRVGTKIIDLSSPDILTIDAIVDTKCVSMVSDVSGANMICPTSILRISINSGVSVLWDDGKIIKNIV
jgi:hypothetical protein